MSDMGRSRAAKPTRAQKILLDKLGLRSKDWLVIGNDPDRMTLVHRGDGRTRVVLKTETPAAGTARESK